MCKTCVLDRHEVTWGFLDRLIEERRRGIEALGAKSAGAMNAAALPRAT